jgi:hypothetical protein
MLVFPAIAAALLNTAVPNQDLTQASTAVPPAATATNSSQLDRRFNHKRAGLEIGAAMAVGVVWYQSQIELNKLDFDFDRTWSDQWRRLSTTAGYRFDDNNPTLNVGHAFMGSIYHQFARANGGSMGEALLFDFITSSTWELTVEHREVVSLNDQIVTSLGGVALGEGLFQLGDYFARSKPTVANRVLMSVFSPAHALGWLFGETPRPADLYEGRMGLAADADHRFALSLGGAQALANVGTGPASERANEAWRGALRLDLELINLPEYGRAQRRSRWTKGGEFTRVEANFIRGDGRMQNQSLSARASMWGHHKQTATADGAAGESLRGSALYLGTATAFDLTSDQLGSVNDFVAAMHLLGPAIDATLFRDRWRLRAGADLFPDFAMVRPYALREVPTGISRAGMKSTLQGSDYYYAFGMHSAARLEAAYRQRLRAGLGVSYTLHDSIEGLDRHQDAYTSPTGIRHEAISRDENLTDQRVKLRVYSEAPVPKTDVSVGVSLDYQHRTGTAAAVERTGEDVRWGVHATYAM